MAVLQRGRIWWIRLQVNGRTICKSLGKGSSREQAEALEAKIRAIEAERRVGLRRKGWADRGIRGKVHHLYRHFDETGALLYVGISLSGLHRLLQHHSSATWGEQIATVRIERFSSREAVLKAEATAIVSEHPRHNVLRPIVQAQPKMAAPKRAKKSKPTKRPRLVKTTKAPAPPKRRAARYIQRGLPYPKLPARAR